MYRTALVFIGLYFTALNVNADTVTLVADEWYPVNGDPSSNKPGYMVEIAKTIFKKHNITVEYIVMPWERSIAETRSGEKDCIIGAATDDAPDFIFPNTSFGELDVGFYTHSSSAWTYDGLLSLENATLGAMSGYSYDNGDIDQYISQHKSTKLIHLEFGNKGLDKLINLLKNKRIHAVLETPAIMEAKLNDLGISDIKQAGTLNFKRPMYIACSPVKKSTDRYIQLLDEGIQQLRQSGELQTILDKYGLNDWQ